MSKNSTWPLLWIRCSTRLLLSLTKEAAKGLLLNNLSVYKGCTIIFDSQEVPDSSSSPLLGAVPPNQEVELGPLAHALAKSSGWRPRGGPLSGPGRTAGPGRNPGTAAAGCLGLGLPDRR
eukprot:jgi/Botrbrau1/23055/Bobra.0489s0001.1